MQAATEIENIDELRRLEGIDDVELHDDIRRLQVGDCVRLTFLSGVNTRETLPVRITRVQAGRFRGRLAGPICEAGSCSVCGPILWCPSRRGEIALHRSPNPAGTRTRQKQVRISDAHK